MFNIEYYLFQGNLIKITLVLLWGQSDTFLTSIPLPTLVDFLPKPQKSELRKEKF